jgi:hypothetical protein
MFYSYHEIFAKGSKFEPGHAAKFWPKVIATVKMLRELEPFILSIAQAPEITVKVLSGQVSYNCMTTGDKRIAIPVATLTSGKNSARIIPPAGEKYFSRYGLSKEQPDGTWLFTANGIDCDILYSR